MRSQTFGTHVKLAKGDPRRLCSGMPRLTKLIGGKGCSLFVGYPLLKMKATSGRLEQKLKLGEISDYDSNIEQTRGFTGAVAFYKKPIRFNDEFQVH